MSSVEPLFTIIYKLVLVNLLKHNKEQGDRLS